MNKKTLASVAIPSLFFLAACGGGSSGGSGPDPMAKDVELTEDTVEEVTVAATDAIVDAGGLSALGAGFGMASAGADGSGEKRTPGFNAAQFAYDQLARVEGLGRLSAANTFSENCSHGGSVSMTMTETQFSLNFNQCKERWESGDWWEEDVMHGSISFSEVTSSSYDDAVRFAINLTTTYKDFDGDSESATIKGGYLYEFTAWNDYRLSELTLTVQESGVWDGQSYSYAEGYENFSMRVSGVDWWVNGKIGSTGTSWDGSETLGGAMTIETVQALGDYGLWMSYPTRGQVKVTAGGNTLLITYSVSGATLSYNDGAAQVYSWSELESGTGGSGGSGGNGGGDTSSATALTSGVGVNGSVAEDEWKYYSIEVPSGASSLVVELYNLSADVDLAVRYGALPTWETADCFSWEWDTDPEKCTESNPQAGTWYIGVEGWDAASYTVRATVN